MSNIVPLATQQCDQIARLHLAYLPSHFKGRSGVELLRLYYQTVTQGNGACGFAAEQADRIAGYVCGVWDSASVRQQLLKRAWLPLVWWGILQGLIVPSMLGSVAGRLRGSSSHSEMDKGYELRPIVVEPLARGTGVAEKLLLTLLGDAAQRGFESIYLYAEPDNIPANRFYQKMGFRQTGQVQQRTAAYLRYERSVAA